MLGPVKAPLLYRSGTSTKEMVFFFPPYYILRPGELLAGPPCRCRRSHIPSWQSSPVSPLLLFPSNPLRWALTGALEGFLGAPSKLNNVNYPQAACISYCCHHQTIPFTLRPHPYPNQNVLCADLERKNGLVHVQLSPLAGEAERNKSVLTRSSPRLISTGQLNTSLRLHLRPINDIVYVEPYSIKDERSYLRGGFTLRCLQRLSRPNVATQLCPWQDNWCTRGSSIPVLSY